MFHLHNAIRMGQKDSETNIILTWMYWPGSGSAAIFPSSQPGGVFIRWNYLNSPFDTTEHWSKANEAHVCLSISHSNLPSLMNKTHTWTPSLGPATHSQPEGSNHPFSSREPLLQTCWLSSQLLHTHCNLFQRMLGHNMMKPTEAHHLQKAAKQFSGLQAGPQKIFAFISQLTNSYYKMSQRGFFSASSTTGNSHFPHLQTLSLLVMQCLSDPAHSQEVRLNSRIKLESSGKIDIITVGEYTDTKDSHDRRLPQETALSDLQKYCICTPKTRWTFPCLMLFCISPILYLILHDFLSVFVTL